MWVVGPHLDSSPFRLAIRSTAKSPYAVAGEWEATAHESRFGASSGMGFQPAPQIQIVCEGLHSHHPCSRLFTISFVYSDAHAHLSSDTNTDCMPYSNSE